MTLYRLKHRVSSGSSVRYAVVNLETFVTVYPVDIGLFFFDTSSIDLHVLFGQHVFLIDRETWNDLKANLAPLARQSLNRLNPRNEETVPDPTLPSEADETPRLRAVPDQVIRIAEAFRPAAPVPQDAPTSSSGSTNIGTYTAHGDETADRHGILYPSGSYGVDWASDGSTTGGGSG